MDRQGRQDRGHQLLRQHGDRHGPGRGRRGPGDRHVASAERGRPGDGRYPGLRPLPDAQEDGRDHAGAQGGLRAHHHPGRGQGDHRGPDGGRPGHPDDDAVGRGGQASLRRDDTAGRRSRLGWPDGLHAAGALRGRRGDQPVQLPAEPRVPQGRPRARGGQLRHHQAGVGYAAVGAQADGGVAGGGRAGRGRAVRYRLGRQDRRRARRRRPA